VTAAPCGRLRAALLGAALVALVGCSTAPIVEGDAPEEPIFSADRVLQADVEYASDVYDPWQGFNRRVYVFNYWFDTNILLPVVLGYHKVTPRFMKSGIHNFFTNWLNLNTLLNSVLQFSPGKAGQTTGRLLVNTTIGLLGLLDPATAMGIPQHQEDFGQTLGRWGVGNGPYLVLPLLGPSSVRDGIGAGVDWYVNNWLREEIVAPETWQQIVWTTLFVIDTRYHIKFAYYQTGSPYEYDLVKWLYTSKRRLDIAK
jgi:phospholipid-binding lipoprotein MlaA